MVSLKWCCRQKEGIKLIISSENLAISYMKMAENALGTMNRERNYNIAFSISACYYSMYYSLYSILMKLGIKCEIHSCTLKFMEELLIEYYSKEEIKIISKAFDLRTIAQYYVDKVLNTKDVDFILAQAPLFVNSSKSILSKINEKDVERIRKKISEFLKN
jgi:uncharacterized protein (UPF0332 family)